MSRFINKTLLSLLVVLMLFGVVTPNVFAMDNEASNEEISNQIVENHLHITHDQMEVNELTIYEYSKYIVSAEGVEGAALYQWQIERVDKPGVWVDIYDAKNKSLGVTLALVESMLDEDSVANLRCLATVEDVVYLSNVLSVNFDKEGKEPTLSNGINNQQVGLISNDGAEGDSEFVTVTIEYVQYAYVLQSDGQTFALEKIGTAFTPYVAMLKRGTDEEPSSLVTTVPNPTIVGFDEYLVQPNGQEIKSKYVEINLPNVKNDVVYTVNYKPAEVNYEVRYFFQNVYDDLYVEDYKIAEPVQKQGSTGTRPDTKVTEAKYQGFTSLYYEPEVIAADGSTVFHVYYERNYYLMEFDCNEGYGTDTIYVRYGTYISVPNPVRAGWVFDGWDLMNAKDEEGNVLTLRESDGTMIPYEDTSTDGITPIAYNDGVKNTLPTTLPPFNTAYKALWKQANTTYNIAYWINEEDGTRTYIGSRIVNELSGTMVTGPNDLMNAFVCDNREHTHTNECLSNCTKNEHTHSITCYRNNFSKISVVTKTDDLACMNAANDGEPENGYLYFVYTNEGQYWPKMYIDGNYYTIVNGSINYNTMLNWVDGELVKKGVAGSYTALKYKAKVNNCNQEEHFHGVLCVSCGMEEHNHSESCKSDLRHYLVYDNDCEDNKKSEVVKGDGSTVVNVYYKYREYTLKFYYAKEEDGLYYVCGNTTEFANGTKNDIESQLYEVSGNWGQVDKLPTISQTSPIAASTYEWGFDEYRVNNKNGKYYYLQFTAPYNADISKMWPVGVFDREKLNENINWRYGDYATFSAWNVDSESWYDATYTNKTLKGNYQRLDYKMLMNNDYTDTMINFLGFWENATMTVDWNVPHKWIYNVYIPILDEETKFDKEHEGIKYKLYGSYNLYDNNTPTNNNNLYHEQTPTALEGFEVSDWEADLVSIYDDTINPNLEVNYINFYYTRNYNGLTFFNHDELDEAKTINSIPFETSLSNKYYEPEYPNSLEPGAYEFAGWYTSHIFNEDTKVDWNTLRMPNSDLRLYAYWKPVIRNVYFYYDYADYQAAKEVNYTNNNHFWYHEENGEKVPESYPIKVGHGSLVGTTYSNIPDAEDGYSFVGWFYMDDDNKKRFAPDSMEVKRDLHLFAEWSSGFDTTYSITYTLEGKVEDPENNVIYPAGTVIANETSGHLTAGRTKTFTAKVGNELYSDFAELSLFPNVNSHSILMDQDKTKNTFEFKYVHDDIVHYRIRYIDKITGLELLPTVYGTSTKAIITEKFKPVSGYLPESYYVRKVLASDGEAGPEAIEQYNNEIIFYYIPDTEHGLYSIRYYTEDIGGGTYTLEQTEVGTAYLGQVYEITINPDKFTGFEYNHTDLVTYSKNGDEYVANVEKYDSSTTKVSGTITENGLEFDVYYNRKKYPYTIEYIEYGTTNVLKTITSTTDTEMKYESILSHTASDVFEKNDIKYLFYATVEKPQTQNISIKASNTANVLTFYYKAKETKINYRAVCLVEGARDYGFVSLNYESASTVKNISGSNAVAGEGYEFIGWYTDALCTNPVNESWRYVPGTGDKADTQSNIGTKLKPGSLSDADSVTYYALFAPIFGKLSITKNVVDENNIAINVNDTFIFRIQGQGKHDFINMMVSIQGSGTINIHHIPIGDYEISELSGWSWKYIFEGETQDVTITKTPQSQITFTNKVSEVDWLNVEDSKENLLEGKTN